MSSATPPSRATSWEGVGDKITGRRVTGTASTCHRQSEEESRSTTCACAALWPLGHDQWRAPPRWRRSPRSAHRVRRGFHGLALAATRQEWKDGRPTGPTIESRGPRRGRLLKEAAPRAWLRLQNALWDQPIQYIDAWIIDQWSKYRAQVRRKVLPTGPSFRRSALGNFDVTVDFNCRAWSIRCWIWQYLPRLGYKKITASTRPRRSSTSQTLLHETTRRSSVCLMRDTRLTCSILRAHTIM